MKKQSLLVTKAIVCLMLVTMLAACTNTNRKLDVPYPHDADEATKQAWIEEKIDYLEEHYGQKVIDVKEDDESITFIFEIEHMSSKTQVEEEMYTK